MTPDPLRLAIALVPIAAYLLLLALINYRRRPFIASGGSDLAVLGVALSGMVLVGPIELFRPELASAEYGRFVWVFLLILYWLWVWLVVLVGKPRLVIYNVSDEQLRPVLSESARQLDPDARWAGDSLWMPTLGVGLHMECFDFMRNTSLKATGRVQNLDGWRTLARALRERLNTLPVESNPRWLGMLLAASALLAVSIAQCCCTPNKSVERCRRCSAFELSPAEVAEIAETTARARASPCV